MSLRKRVTQELFETYVREHGVPAGGESVLNTAVDLVTRSISWRRPEDFGSSNFYDLYNELLEVMSREVVL
jgi:hypothetical protein